MKIAGLSKTTPKSTAELAEANGLTMAAMRKALAADPTAVPEGQTRARKWHRKADA